AADLPRGSGQSGLSMVLRAGLRRCHPGSLGVLPGPQRALPRARYFRHVFERVVEKGPAFFAYADNYLIDLQCGVIMDVKASRAIRQAEVGAARTMIERTEERFGLKPQRLAADSPYGAAPMLNWLVEEKQIAPHIPVLDRSKREDGTFSRQNFRYVRAPTRIPARRARR